MRVLLASSGAGDGTRKLGRFFKSMQSHESYFYLLNAYKRLKSVMAI